MASHNFTATCRLCGHFLSGEPIVELHHAPSGAQMFLDADELESDGPIHLVICECRSCGLVQHSSPPVPYYREAITAAGLSQEMIQHRVRQFRLFVDRYGLLGKSVIEIGCGRGDLLLVLRDAGLRPTGLEYGVASETQLIEGIEIEHGYPTQRKLIRGAPFEAFVCINFLEHAPDPNSFLTGIAANIADSAVGLFEVPSLEHVLETGRGYDWIADHVSYFSESTLRLALELNGFEVDDIERAWKGFDLVAYVRRRPASGACRLHEDLGEAIGNVRAFLDAESASARRVAIWGASHQALTLLAEAGAANRVPYIVDSAPFKQGRFAPVTHLPIVAPATLTREPVDVVLVMAAGYSEEVVRLLRSQEGFAGRVTVLRGNRIENA